MTELTQQEQVQQNDVNKAVWSACDAFRGGIEPSTYKDYILTMLFVKYISDVHKHEHAKLMEQYKGNVQLVDAMMAKQRFVLPKGASFWDLYAKREEAGNGERIDLALDAIENANGNKLKNVFQDISFNSDKLGDEKTKNQRLGAVLEAFGKDELDLSPARVGKLDIIGNAYEFLIKHFAAGSGKSAGEFYTPPEVSDLLAQLLDPQPGDTICDPACGSGSLLLKCGALVRENHNSKNYELYGQEAIGGTWALAKMNMFLHGEDNHRIEWGDTLNNPKLTEDDNQKLMSFDIVTANPPFSLDKWGHENAAKDKFARFHRGVPPKTKGDYAFLSHMVETIAPKDHGLLGGRVGVVVPHGVLFRGSAEGTIRKQLIDEGLLDAVIGLPEKLFFGTGIPAAILIFKKKKTDDKVLFIDASKDYKPGKNQNQLTEQNIKDVLEAYKNRAFKDKYAYLADLDEIIKNDYNLNIPRYVDTFEEEAEVDLVEVRKERLALQSQLTKLETEMAKYLEELGYGA
ncbi:type I restriction-modification system subunit M [Vibrio vulnificus]|nr:type I restriction-modification system subunit M [Vibrio vulnificus]EHZ2746550.1 type I restriction-modification system subunit M [Vibrio vulnificus]EIU7824532.1 type I restriction-modification system subunit M [Vibrio vulnificus]ELP1869971.1 type I restriction-modification system subunit M [Vibrio vulnificus]HAS8348809.1 type I restriction-modification system subunit M [Vibrio vulnificus]